MDQLMKKRNSKDLVLYGVFVFTKCGLLDKDLQFNEDFETLRTSMLTPGFKPNIIDHRLERLKH